MAHRRFLPAAVALGCVVLAAATYALALGTTAGGRADARVLAWLSGLGGARADALASDLTRFFDPAQYACLAAALVCLALARARPRQALVIVMVLGGAALTAQLLKSGLAAARPYPTADAASIGAASWPSGHTTGAVALALCLVLIAPPRLRPAASALASAVAVLVPLALLVQPTHWPSDVLGGACVAGAWFALGVAALRASEAPVAQRGTLVVAGAVVLAGFAAAAAAAAARPAGAAQFVQDHTALALCGLALAAAGTTVVGSALRAAGARRRPASRPGRS